LSLINCCSSKGEISKNLYLVQHGEAKREEEDPARGLTESGKDDVSHVAAALRKMNVPVRRILHSGKTRAMQTAQILEDNLKKKQGVAETDSLAPMDDPLIWVKRIDGIDEDIMLVGHLPYMAKLTGVLLCGDKEKACIDFKMGGVVCCKRIDDRCWTVERMIVPEMLK
jgi:phosphohistidine phosphatase